MKSSASLNTGSAANSKTIATWRVLFPLKFSPFLHKALADLRAPASGFKFFKFHAVFGKIWQNRMLAFPQGIGVLPRGKSWIRHCYKKRSRVSCNHHSILMPRRLLQTRMHSSRMRTARSSSRQGGGSPPGTPPEQAPGTRHPPGAGTPLEPGTPRTRHPPGPGTPPDQAPPRGQNSWHTLLKIWPCPKLRLRAV